MLAHFRPIKKNMEKNKLNTRMEKLHFAFRMYDLDGDDRISKVQTWYLYIMVIQTVSSNLGYVVFLRHSFSNEENTSVENDHKNMYGVLTKI